MSLKITKDNLEAIQRLDSYATDLWKEVETAVEKFDGCRERLFELLDGISSDLRGEYDERSEKWQEGERGVAASEWIDGLEAHASNVEEALEVNAPEWLGDMASIETEPSE